MANRLQHLRGSEAEHSTFTGAKGEISLVTDTSSDRIPTGEVRVHDGTTAGGLPLTLGTTSKPLTNNIVLGSGVGINFNNYGTEDSDSATTVGSNLLDDYEEGSFTPVLADAQTGGNSASIGTETGLYTKIGRQVTCKIELVNIDTTGMTGGNPIWLRGLPFIVDSSLAAVTRLDDWDFNSTGWVVVETAVSSTTGRFFNVVDNSSDVIMTVSQINSGGADCSINLTYFV